MVFNVRCTEWRWCVSISCIIFFVAFLISGGVLYSKGCDNTLHPDCSKYTFEETVVTGYSVTVHTCSTCTQSHEDCNTSCDSQGNNCHTTCHTVCDVLYYYDCYNSYAFGSYGANESKYCKFDVSVDVLSNTTALQRAQSKYPLGEKNGMYVDGNDCYKPGELRQFALIGVVLLSLSAFFLTVLSFSGIKWAMEKEPTPPVPKIEETDVEMIHHNASTAVPAANYAQMLYANPADNQLTAPDPTVATLGVGGAPGQVLVYPNGAPMYATANGAQMYVSANGVPMYANGTPAYVVAPAPVFVAPPGSVPAPVYGAPPSINAQPPVYDARV
jgi:hypothetical protein